MKYKYNNFNSMEKITMNILWSYTNILFSNLYIDCALDSLSHSLRMKSYVLQCHVQMYDRRQMKNGKKKQQPFFYKLRQRQFDF